MEKNDLHHLIFLQSVLFPIEHFKIRVIYSVIKTKALIRVTKGDSSTTKAVVN